jgi:demethoxyubiquinone hydroxylase (CLK1/Coq7/Cat5 family)
LWGEVFDVNGLALPNITVPSPTFFKSSKNVKLQIAAGSQDEASKILDKIIQFNRAGCIATSKLYDWLKFGPER